MGKVNPGLCVPEQWPWAMQHGVSAFLGPCWLGQGLGSQGCIFSVTVPSLSRPGAKRLKMSLFFLQKIDI